MDVLDELKTCSMLDRVTQALPRIN